MINLTHTVEEVNLILLALTKLPFDAVHELVAKVKNQADPQYKAIMEQQEAATKSAPQSVDDVIRQTPVTKTVKQPTKQ